MVSNIRNWVTTTIDFANAFINATLSDDEPVWMHIPRGYRSIRLDQTTASDYLRACMVITEPLSCGSITAVRRSRSSVLSSPLTIRASGSDKTS